MIIYQQSGRDVDSGKEVTLKNLSWHVYFQTLKKRAYTLPLLVSTLSGIS
jgi:hypothetical protein